MRILYTCLLTALLVGCSLPQDEYSDLLDQISEAVEEKPDSTESPSDDRPTSPQPPSIQEPTPTPEPTPEPVEESEAEKKPGRCRDSGKLVVGHNHECTVGGVNRGASVLTFTGSRGGLEALKSHTTGELKLGLPWNYSCELAKDVKVCGPKGCLSAQNDRTAWVNYDSTPRGNMCTQWARWGHGNDPSKVFRRIGASKPKEVYFMVDGNRVNLCTKQWNREQRCS